MKPGDKYNKYQKVKIPKKYKGFKVKVDNNMRDFGETDLEKKTIRINRKKSLKKGGHKELKDTLIHEKLHAKHPKMHEKTVRRKTKRKLKKLYK